MLICYLELFDTPIGEALLWDFNDSKLEVLYDSYGYFSCLFTLLSYQLKESQELL